MFVHLRIHTEFSVVDGTNRIDEIVAAAAADRQPALAITDLGNLFGTVKFYKETRSAGVKPLIGADVWVQVPGKDAGAAPARLLRYLTLLLRGREPRHLGHNPAGAVMILYLMGATLVIGVTGFLMTTDAYGGNELVETLHTTAVDLTLVAIAVHVGANAYESLKHRENMFKAMVTGRKRAPAADEHTETHDSFIDGWDDTQPSEPAALQPPPRTHRI